MVTVPESVIPLFLRLTHANAPYATAEGARRRVRQRALRPAPYGPPPRLRPGVSVDVAHRGGWPVYTIGSALSEPRGNVVYLHGGGWVNEVSPWHWRMAAQVAVEANTTITLPIYPLVPFGTAQQALEGVVSLVEANRTRYGPVCVAGDSAGGQIALSSALALRDAGIILPLTLLVSPALDLTWSNPRIPQVQPSDPWLGVPGGTVLSDLWSGGLDLTDPIVSPLAGEFAGLGPVTVFTGTRDILNPDAHLLAARARSAGVELTLLEVHGQVHVHPLLPTKVGATARDAIVAAVRRATR